MTSVPEKVRIQNGLDSRKLQEMSTHFQQLLDSCRGRLQETETQLNYILTLVQRSWYGDIEAIENLSEIIGSPVPTIHPSPNITVNDFQENSKGQSYRLSSAGTRRPQTGQAGLRTDKISANNNEVMSPSTDLGQKGMNTGRGVYDLDQFRHLQSRVLFFNSVSRDHDILMQHDAAQVKLRGRPYSATSGRPKSRLGLKNHAAALHRATYKPNVSVGDLLNTIYHGNPIDAVTNERVCGPNDSDATQVQKEGDYQPSYTPDLVATAERDLYRPSSVNRNDSYKVQESTTTGRQIRISSAVTTSSRSSKPPMSGMYLPETRKLFKTRSATPDNSQTSVKHNNYHGAHARSRASSAKSRTRNENLLVSTEIRVIEECQSPSQKTSMDDTMSESPEMQRGGSENRPKSGMRNNRFNPLPMSVQHFSEDEQQMREQERSLEQGIYELQKKLNIRDDGIVLP